MSDLSSSGLLQEAASSVCCYSDNCIRLAVLSHIIQQASQVQQALLKREYFRKASPEVIMEETPQPNNKQSKRRRHGCKSLATYY